MTLLVEIVLGVETHRISDHAVSLTNYWKPAIISFDDPQRTIFSDYGGDCALKLGGIGIAPDLFEDDWPPPKTAAIEVIYTADTEANGVTLYAGTAVRRDYNHKVVNFTMRDIAYNETEADATVYTGSDLETELATILTGIAEISSLDITNGRAVSPGVEYTTSGARLNIELASTMAAFYGHMFYVSGATAYLVDMLGYAGTRTINEYEFFPPSYWDKDPAASVKETTTGNDFTRFSAYPQGNQLSVDAYHTTEANINTALDDILTLENRTRCSVRLPLDDDIPTPGERIQWTDTRTYKDTTVSMYVRTLRYLLSAGRVEVEGDAVIS